MFVILHHLMIKINAETKFKNNDGIHKYCITCNSHALTIGIRLMWPMV